MNKKQFATMVCLATMFAVWGCVRIPAKFEAHITVDIRQHIEQQAGSALDYIEGKTDAPPAAQPAPTPEKKSWLDRGRDYFAPACYAAELKESSPKVTEILTKLRDRFPQITALKAAGGVGENNRGYLDARDTGKLSPQDQQTIAAENADRKALYQEIARLNADRHVTPETVEVIYALQRLKRAKAGEVVQLPSAGADFEAFKASPAGQRLGAGCAPSAWVTIR